MDKFSSQIAECDPLLRSRGLNFPERGGNNLERKILHDIRYHLLETLNFERGVMLIHSRHVVAKRRREVFLIAEHDVYVRCDAAALALCPFFPALTFPQEPSVAYVVRNHRAGPPPRPHPFHTHSPLLPSKP